MGGIYIRWHPKFDTRSDSYIAESLEFEKAFNLPLSVNIDFQNICINIYKKMNGTGGNIFSNNNGDICFCTGTFIYNNSIGITALKCALRDYQNNKFDRCKSIGHYCIGFWVNSELHLMVDPLGVYKIYYTKDLTFFSSSFLLASMATPDKTIDIQGVYEYLFIGATFGESTVVEQVKTLIPSQKIVLKDDRVEFEKTQKLPKCQWHGSFEEHFDANLRALRSYFHVLAEVCETKISCALSGGYDTRLLLALMTESKIPLELYVYGKPADPDVRIAKFIADAEGRKIDHIDKSTVLECSPSEFEQIVHKNFQTLDGLPTDGIIDNGADLYTRERRTRGKQILINGGAGEIYRNYTFLMDRPYLVRDLIWAFYMRFDPKACSNIFNETRYVDGLCNKVKSELDLPNDELERSDIEYAYPVFWCRCWMSRTTNLDNRFGYSLLPFLDFNVMKRGVCVPLRFKHFGKFEAAMLRAIDPKLAAYESIYHQSFAQNPSIFHMLRDVSTYLRPPWLRRYTYRIKAQVRLRRPQMTSGVFDRNYLERVIDPSFPETSIFIDPKKNFNVEQYNRICTLEYFLERL